MVGKNDRLGLMVTEKMVGYVYHKTQNGIEDIRATFARPPKQETLPRLRLPWIWYFVYLVVGVVVWKLWPGDKELPTEVWIGVLSFEGLLAGLLASVGQATTYEGAVPSVIAFWSALDANIGRTLKEAVRRWREDPTEGASTSPFRNAIVVAIESMFLLPLIVVIDSRWAAAVMSASLVWTARRIMSDAVGFFLPEYATVLPRLYWVTRSWHEDLAYCPVCHSTPQPPAWPPPRQGSPLQGIMVSTTVGESSLHHQDGSQSS